ncbi:iron ABC transporter [Pseudohongiella nitratireducens]|uniref:Iron ABC transporter n=1 Tax=Pseudohongiella nitratireducens TaxID=1768907 RepID=A0A916QLW0_9GAMM|nr:iron ABC transporter permease [Pseudohongiella nitratireducens]MDF1623029.1 iron ABC transporter permease [Pseudohongiella nitratireducens]GFZ78979.1 iron ABC transporter [Pseudohongiella nitratireducens]
MKTIPPLYSLVLLCIVLVAAVMTSLLSGSYAVPVSDIFSVLFSPDDSVNAQIIHDIRLPRTLSAIICGAMLALSGVIMQVLLRNPLADPYILGVSGGSAVGALTALSLGASGIWLTQSALAGAIISIFLVFGLAARGQQWSSQRLLLTGVVVSAGWGAVINVLLTTSTASTVQSMLFWLMGDLSQSRISLWHFAFLFICLAILLSQARALNTLARGELLARTLGVPVRGLNLALFLLASAMTATSVVIAGSVGFVGLIIPHLLRLAGIQDHRWLIPASALLGAAFLTLADCLARTMLAPQQLPVGVLTAVIGVPIFLFMLNYRQGYQHTTEGPANDD